MNVDELEYELDGNTYLISKLPLGKSQEVLLKLTGLGLFGGGDEPMTNVLSKIRVEDLNFFRNQLLGEYCQVQNESGNWVPLGKSLVENHFSGRLGSLLHILGKCLLHNFSDFLADLRLDELVGASEAE